MKASLVVISLTLLGLVSIPRANADDVNGAAKAFSQAQEAMLHGDVARAADLYELADELSPSAPALRNATRARMAVGHLAMAATNAAALLRRYPSDKESRDMAEAVLAKLAPQLAQLDVTCSAACTLLVDGKVVASVAREQHSLFSQPGARSVTGVFEDGRKALSQITATPNHIMTVRLEAPPRPANPIEPKVPPRIEPAAPVMGRSGTDRPVTEASRPIADSSHGISRWWVVGGGVVTVGFGAATIVSGLATLSTRDQIREAVAAGDHATAQMLYSTGNDQQTRTNVLLGATIAAGVGTVVLALFTNWSPERSERDLAIVPTRDGVSLVYGSRF